MKGMTAGNFIREIVESDLRSGKHRRIVTRFPPEPNGYLHIGHAKSICLNFGLALEHGGVCHLRFDDTNPSTESVEYAEAIQADVRWLGFDWGDRMFYASGYFEQLYEYAVQLITKGKAYVDSLSAEEITHSLCTLEFEDHRPLYDWFLDNVSVPCHPQQIEFARLNLTHTVMSKRRLLELVGKGHVNGWDDPRLPTLQGLRRRGYTPEAIRAFCEHIGVQKRDGMVEMALLEHFIREDLNKRAPRVMAVLRPLRVVLENYPEGRVEEEDAVNNPEDPGMGKRKVPFSRVLYIERDDFREAPPKKFFRLAPGQEVRLRYAYIIKCVGVVKDERTGEVVELRCTYDPETRTGGPQAGRKVKGTIHWVSAAHALDAEVRLYDHLFVKADAGDIPEGQDYTVNLNPNSLERLTGCRVEPSLAGAQPGSRYQFERQGYFCVDPDSAAGQLVFNRTVALRDSWAKIEKAQQDG